MPNPNPAWKHPFCAHCAAGLRMVAASGLHWTDDCHPCGCTAPTADEHISALKSRIAELEADKLRLDWLLNQLKSWDMHVDRDAIDAAMEDSK